jgi:hypothetical protein
MRNPSIVSSRLLACDAVKLGRLVLDVRSPEQEFFDSGSLPGDPAITPADILIKHQYNFNDLLQRTSGSRFNSTLTRFLAASHANRQEQSAHISAIRNTTYQLQNSTDIFERICSSDQARRWLERALIRDRKVFMVVGMETLLDATLSTQHSASRSVGAEITAPAEILAAATTAGIPLPYSELLDVGAGAEIARGTKSASSLFAAGEQVYAVQYRKLEFSWFSSRKLENASLEVGNRWKVYWLRTAEEEDEDDVVRVDLAAIRDEEDVGMDCEVLEVDGEDYEQMLIFCVEES